MKSIGMAFLGLVLAASSAADLTGEWSGTFKVSGAEHSVPQYFTMKQDGNKVTGTGGPDAQEQYPIEQSRVDGDHLQFELTTGDWKFSYDLQRKDKDTLTGNLVIKSITDRRVAKVVLNRTKHP